VAGGPTTTGTLILSSFFFSRVCGACRRALRVHALELGKATGAQRDVSGSSAGGIGDPHEGKGAGGASTSRAIPHDVLIWNSPRDPDVSRALSHAKQRAPGGPRCTERGALAQAQVEAAQEVCAVSVQFSTHCCLW